MRSSERGWKQKQDEKKGGVGGEEKLYFCKKGKKDLENFYWGFLNLKKKNTKKDKKKKKKIFWQVMFTNWGRGREHGLGARGLWGPHKHSHAVIHPTGTHSDSGRPRDAPGPDVGIHWPNTGGQSYGAM